MYKQAKKNQENKSRDHVTAVVRNKESRKHGLGLADHRVETVSQMKWQEAASVNTQPQPTAQLQSVVNSIIQCVSIDSITDRMQRVFFRTLTSGTLLPETAAQYLEIIKGMGGKFSEATGLLTALQQMTHEEYVTFYTRTHAGREAQVPGRDKTPVRDAFRIKAVRKVPGRDKTPGTEAIRPQITAKTPGTEVVRPKITAKMPGKDVVRSKSTMKTSGTDVVRGGVRGIRDLRNLNQSKTPAVDLSRIRPFPNAGTGASPNKKRALSVQNNIRLPPIPGGQVDRLEQAGVNPMGVMPWTHNSTAGGLMGILTTGQFLPSVETNVNFRYDLDSRYHDGVSIVMRPQMEWCWDGSHVQDLYHQSEHLGGPRVSDNTGRRVHTKRAGHSALSDHQDPRLDIMRKHLAELAKNSDFRDTQMERLGEKGQLPMRKKGAKTNPNYALPLVNPQLRIPGDQPIGFSHIDFIIITEEVNDMLKKWGEGIGIKEVESGVRKFLSRQRVPHNKTLSTRVGVGLQRLEALRKQGNVVVVPGGGDNGGYSHKAGRVDKRSASDEEAMKKAASQGMEFHGDYFEPEVNNSHAALNMETFIQFQTAYYQKLAAKDGHRAQEIAIEILKKNRRLKSGKEKTKTSATVEAEHESSAPLTHDEKEAADNEFDELVMSNNCLPHAILGRQLTLIEARQLRLNLLEHRQAIGDFLDADQPIVQAIVRQFRVDQHIIIYERNAVRRRFLVTGNTVQDVTVDGDLELNENTCLKIERVDGNHFIRKQDDIVESPRD